MSSQFFTFFDRDQEIKVRLWGNKADLIDVKSIGNVIIITSTIVRKFGSMSSFKFNHSFYYLPTWFYKG